MLGKAKNFNLGSMMAASFKKHLFKADKIRTSTNSVKKEEVPPASQGWGIRNPQNPNPKQVQINKPKTDLTN